MNKTVYAIIVLYNGLEWIEKCLKSIVASELTINVVIVDNKSTDGSLEYVKNNFPQFSIVENQKNIGFGKANNLGLKIAKDHNADHVLLLNQDAWIFPDTLQKMVDVQQKHPDFYIVTPMLLQASQTALEIHFEKLISPGYCKDLVSDFLVDREQISDIYELKFMHAAAWLLSKECVENVGGFDPLFTHNSEDTDYVNRVKYYNKKIGVCPTASAVHDTITTMMSYDTLPASKRRRLYYVTNIAQQKNINYSFLHGFLFVFWYNFKAMLFNLTKLQLIFIFDRCIMWIFYCSKIPVLLKHRKQCRTPGSTFLQ